MHKNMQLFIDLYIQNQNIFKKMNKSAYFLQKGIDI